MPVSGINWLFLKNKGEDRAYEKVKKTIGLVEKERLPDFRFSQVTEFHGCLCFSPTLEGHRV